MPRFLLRAFCLVTSLQGLPWCAETERSCVSSPLHQGMNPIVGAHPIDLITSLRLLLPRPFKLVIRISTTKLVGGVVGSRSIQLTSLLQPEIMAYCLVSLCAECPGGSQSSCPCDFPRPPNSPSPSFHCLPHQPQRQGSHTVDIGSRGMCHETFSVTQ